MVEERGIEAELRGIGVEPQGIGAAQVPVKHQQEEGLAGLALGLAPKLGLLSCML